MSLQASRLSRRLHFFQCRIEQFPSVFPPRKKKGEEQYEHQQFHLDILLNILSASSSRFLLLQASEHFLRSQK